MTCVDSYPGSRLVHRLSGYPVLNDSFNQATSYYTWVKDSSRYIAAPLNLAESGVKSVVGSTKPIVSRFDDKISYAENVACSGLDHFEERFPVVLKPTEEIVEDTKEYYGSHVQPLVNRAVHPITSTYEGVKTRVSDVRVYGQETVTSAVTYGVGGLNRFGESGVGQRSLHLLGQVLDAADIFTDRYLASDEEKEGEKAPEEEVVGDCVVKKATVLTNKVRRRMRAKAIREMANVRVRSTEAVQKLHFTVDLMEYARENLDGAKGRATQLKEEFSETLQQLEEQEKTQENCDADKTIDNRILSVSKSLADRLRLTLLTTSTVFYRHLSDENQTRLDKAKSQAEHLFETISKTERLSDLTSSFFFQTRQALDYAQQALDLSYDVLSQSNIFKFLKQETQPLTESTKPSECVEMKCIADISSEMETVTSDEQVQVVNPVLESSFASSDAEQDEGRSSDCDSDN